ncbi:MAG: HAMP domain-containing protein [Chloroflexi bacterium CFX4]|nr:HAMP domain-containing protein [Chloroflexi bacterium CFX4]MDL1921193.1 HAMP domain-containing protein [Chloroflexi bacterium CFX3]
MSLRRRLLIYLLLLAIVPMLLVSLTAYLITSRNLTQIERANLEESAESVVRLFEDIEVNLANITVDYANWDELHAQSAVDEPDAEWISINLSPEAEVSITTTHGLEIVGIYNINNRLNYAHGAAEQVVQQLGDLLGRARMSSTPITRLLLLNEDVYLVALTAIRTSASEDPNGVLIVGRRVRLDDADRIRTLTVSEVAFYSGEKRLAATENHKARLDPNALRAATSGSLTIDQTQSEFALIYQPIMSETGEAMLTIVLQRSRSALTAARQSTLQSLVVWVVLVSLIAASVAALLGRPIVRTLSQMVASADQIAAGDYSRRMPLPARQDELHQVASAFNQMTERLVRNIEMLHAKTRELDEKNGELMLANAAANEAVRTERDFIVSMSHELRTPLTAIIGYSDMLILNMSGELSDVQRRRIQIIRDSGNRLLSLINDLLDLSRIQAGRLELNIAPYAPAAMLERTASELNVLAQQNQLKFVQEIDPNLPPLLLGDEKRLQQIVTNLLGNAFKFTREGEVRLRAHANPAAKMWVISVTDTGEGIPTEALDTIFEKYQQIKTDMQRGVTGTGLGLPITRDLVELMGGLIAVKSTLGVGSTFTISLPMVVPQTLDNPVKATKV